MKNLYTLFFLLLAYGLQAQSGSIKGQLQDSDKNAVGFANIALYSSVDSTLKKVEASDEKGIFKISGIKEGAYYLVASFVGTGEVKKTGINVTDGQEVDLGVLVFTAAAIELGAATVTASRVMVEVKPDRTVFNVEGTINSTGDNAMSLMRKAPGVLVDNNDNITVLGRAGVQLFVDGKRVPLSGDDLTNYLRNIPSDQIDRIDIITNPGAKYDSEGNAGIIDVRLKKDKSHGTNGSVSGTLTQGQFLRGNGSATANYRNKRVNIFGNIGGSGGESFNTIVFDNFQNGLFMEEENYTKRAKQNINYRFGTDFFLSDKQTLGFLVTGMNMKGNSNTDNDIEISVKGGSVDSVLIADSDTESAQNNNSFNLNYQYEDRKKERSLNIDLDYGRYQNEQNRYQPNLYYDAARENVLTEVINAFETPSKIQIATARVDYEQKLLGGKLSAGLKYSQVISDNTFLFFDEVNNVQNQNDSLSNTFKYDEKVYAVYTNYTRKFGEKWGISAGVRMETTDATGDLKAFVPELAEPPVELFYTEFFPSAGLTYQANRMNVFALNYGRRINRPDYNVLNPFNNQLSQISYQKGNPRLQPEIVNNIELGYTYAYRYNFKIAYSKTSDQITRLIAPDENDPRANFISWANLAEQTIWSANISAPVQFTDYWNAYFNISGSHVNNQADYTDDGGGIVDVQAFTYNFYSQQTFNLPAGFKAEVSGWFSGPGIWGGVFRYETSWSLNLGLQKRFLNDQLNVRLTANDIFYQTGWNGYSEFNGLRTEGYGRWDSRYFSVSMSYNFGNKNVKSRRRKTGLEDEAGRVKSN
ncbi:MAG: TonB-dependent receptor domain-containing protein [Saprospiraceae bacterium]